MNPLNRFLAISASILLVPLQAQQGATETGLLSWWTFSSDRIQGSIIKAWQGGPDISPSGSYRFASEPLPARLELPARDERFVVAESPEKAVLPVQDFSIEAWVRVDQTQEWGGIFSAIQDNGEFERGLLLGFRGDRFTLGLATQAAGKLTYLSASEPFSTGHWNHVVGTYDGKTQNLFVNGRLAGSSTVQSGPVWYAPNGPVVVGAYQDEDEFYRTRGALQEIRIFKRALNAAEIAQRQAARKAEFPAPTPEPDRLDLAYGPFIDWIDRNTAMVTWETEEAMPSTLELFSPDGKSERFGSSSPVRKHSVRLTGLSRDTEYRFRLRAPNLGDREHATRRYVFDTSFHYQPVAVAAAAAAAGPAATAPSPSTKAAAEILKESGVRQGWCVVLGATDGSLAAELARQSDLKVLIVESNLETVQKIRANLETAGVAGVRASVQHITTDELPYGTFMANLIVSESAISSGLPPRWPAVEVHRLLRPAGGVALLGSAKSSAHAEDWKKWAAGSELAGTEASSRGDRAVHYRRDRLAGAGDWSHQYGNPDNTSTSMDEQVKGELQVSWWGDPGPRPMPDRGPRNPAPLSVNGRLFVQGDRILFGLDAYNGSILWSVIAPEVRRSNLPRDCSNMAADNQFLYVAHNRFCLTFDGQTGERKKRFSVPEGSPGERFDWGFLSVIGQNLIGSRVKHDSRYQGDDGEWFEDYHEDQVSRVTSESLFGMDPDGNQRWMYKRGAILNSTITIGDEMIFFIESRNPRAVNASTGRLSPDVLTDTHLVALDLRSGAQLWTKPQDFSRLQFMTYLVYSQNTLVATGTDKSKVYHTYAFNAPARTGTEGQPVLLGGQQLWEDTHKEDKGHHSGHLQHPVVIDGVFYSDQRSFDLRSGKTLRTDLPERRGCGTMSAARNALFFRHHYQSMWDLKSDKRVQFEGIRSGCWLGLVPAGGMLLAPETSAGCSCTHAIQTSLGYIPKAFNRPAR